MPSKDLNYTHKTVEGIPMTLIAPKGRRAKTGIIYYHGWGSSGASSRFRGELFALYGYPVLIADGMGHGERGSYNYDDVDETGRYLPVVLLQNLREFPMLREVLMEETGVEELFVSGHSMGGMTACGLLSHPQVDGAVAFNGTGDWGRLLKEVSPELMAAEVREALLEQNPMGKLPAMEEKAICLINGELDESVDPKSQEAFYHELLKVHRRPEALRFELVEYTPHLVTTNMFELAIDFLQAQSMEGKN
ncbi:MAG: alpha/beta fold hydrolase [Tissierellia bacterium]|nr:alpha/beta fold hydrolase [Tissierellia bacterium]